jgi:hypothetical protein
MLEIDVLSWLALVNLQAAGQARLQALQLRMTEHLEQRGQRQLLMRCTAAWRQRVRLQRCAQQMLQRAQQRQLQACCGAWVLLTRISRCAGVMTVVLLQQIP